MPHRQIKKNITLLIAMYVLMSVGLVGSLGYAIYQNWQLKVQSTRSELARQASVGNFIVENAIVDATKSLHAAQRAILPLLRSGPLNARQAHELLQSSLNEFRVYSNSSYEGTLLYLDRDGKLLGRTDQFPVQQLNFADRFYFQHLKDYPELDQTISPLVKAHITGEWVFHVAVPLRDQKGNFLGVLAQQIRATDIARDLRKYIGPLQTGQMVSQTSSAGVAFVYPLQLLAKTPPENIATPYADFARRSSSPQDAFTWPLENESKEQELLVGYEYSELSGFLSTMHVSLESVWFDFLKVNSFLLGIACTALLLITVLFLRLYCLSNHLSDVLHDSLCDTLTQIPNRRAFEDMYSRLLREAARSRKPLSVLFIDIDYFKRFNDDYGHDGGDAALIAIAQTLRSCAVRPLDFVCRWGGEEFVMLLPHTPKEAALLLADKVLAAVRQLQLTDLQGHPMRRITVSIGIACNTIDSPKLGENLVMEADTAMQQAKHAGRNQCMMHVRTNA